MTTDPDVVTVREFEAATDRAKRLITSMPVEDGRAKLIAAAAAFIRAAESPPDALCCLAIAASDLSGCIVTVRATSPTGRVAIYSEDGAEIIPAPNSRLSDSDTPDESAED